MNNLTSQEFSRIMEELNLTKIHLIETKSNLHNANRKLQKIEDLLTKGLHRPDDRLRLIADVLKDTV